MRPGRLAVLVGTLVATGALYLGHLMVDDAAFRAITGADVPSIWQELGQWGRPAAALLAAGLVAVAFRPSSGPADRLGGIAALLLAVGAAAGVVLAWQVAADDASVVSTALGAGGSGASAGLGFWVLLAGAGGAAVGALWDLVAAGRAEGGVGGAPSVGEQNPAPL